MPEANRPKALEEDATRLQATLSAQSQHDMGGSIYDVCAETDVAESRGSRVDGRYASGATEASETLDKAWILRLARMLCWEQEHRIKAYLTHCQRRANIASASPPKVS